MEQNPAGVDQATEDFYTKMLDIADKEWRAFSEEEKKKYNLLAKESKQTGQDYYFFKKVKENTGDFEKGEVKKDK